MPAMYTLWNTRFEKRWNVGTDDFVIPALIGIAIRLVCFVLISGVLIYFYFAPLRCELDDLQSPPILYSSLFSLLILETLVLIVDTIIFSVSCRGRIDHVKYADDFEDIKHRIEVENGIARDRKLGRGKEGWPDPDHFSPRRSLKCYIYFRMSLYLFEYASLITCTYAIWAPVILNEIAECHFYDDPLKYARAVAVILWITLSVYVVGFLIFLDPIGCCTPGLLEELDFLDRLDDWDDETTYKVFQFHRSYLQTRSIQRRMQGIFCCLGLKGHQSRGIALEDAASVLQTIFSDVDLVTTDLAAGFILLNRHQKRVKQKSKKANCLDEELKSLTFEKMGNHLIPPGYMITECCNSRRKVDFSNLDDFLLFEDLVHYMHYALGIYGWPLYLFMNTSCGLCSLASQICFRCYCRQLHERTMNGDIAMEDSCFCGVASIRQQSPTCPKISEDDIKFVSLKNDYFKAPYMICVDHVKETVVIAIRGTLSIKDALTDVTVSGTLLDVLGVEGAYSHNGMHRTATWIKTQLLNRKKPQLKIVCDQYPSYHLVITGHSLGAGVASVLSLLLRPQFPDLTCYVFSPPGCVFSFPLAVYSRQFITSVVLGNDMVPRLSCRSLHHLKRQVEFLLKTCHKSKHQVLFQPRCCGFCCRHDDDPSVEMTDIEHRIFPDDPGCQISRCEEIMQSDVEMVKKPPSLLWWTFFTKTSRKREKGPGVHQFVQKVTKPEEVPRFLPGTVIHIESHRRVKSCWLSICNPPKVKATWIQSEDLCVIVADRGIVEDHLPNSVMSALKECRQQALARLEQQHEQSHIDVRRWEMAQELREKMELRTIEVEDENVWEENTPKGTSTLAPSSISTNL